MKKTILSLSVLTFLLFSTTGLAATKQPVKKSSRALEGTLQTRIGKLTFEKGYPSNATIAKLYIGYLNA
jgi:hypothetical protein